MKNMRIVTGAAPQFLKPADDVALAWTVGITMRCNHHAQRGSRVPFHFDLVEITSHGMFEQPGQITFQTHDNRLRFRVAHAAIELHHIDRAILADHQSGVEEAGKRRTFALHAGDCRLYHFAHHTRMHRRRHHRRRRIRPHAASVRSDVTVLEPFMILTGGQRQGVAAIRHDDETGFLAIEKIFDDHTRTGSAHLVADQHHVDGVVCFLEISGNHHALAGGETVGLDDDRRTAFFNILMRGLRPGERLMRGGRDLVARHELLGEILGTLQLCGSTSGAEYFETGSGEIINDTSGQRRFRPNHR